MDGLNLTSFYKHFTISPFVCETFVFYILKSPNFKFSFFISEKLLLWIIPEEFCLSHKLKLSYKGGITHVIKKIKISKLWWNI